MMRALGMLKRVPFLPAACSAVPPSQDQASCTGRAWPCRPARNLLHALCRQAAAGERTSSSVAVLAHSPMAMVLTSGCTASMVSRMALIEYACPPAGADNKLQRALTPSTRQAQVLGPDRSAAARAARRGRSAPCELMYSFISAVSSKLSKASMLATTFVATCARTGWQAPLCGKHARSSSHVQAPGGVHGCAPRH